MTDKEMIAKIQNGCREYLNDVIKKYYDDILRFCIYQTGNPNEAYDLTQDTFLRFIRHVDSYQYRNLKAYLIMIARNLCMDYFRGKKDAASLSEEEETGREDAGIDGADNRIYLAGALKEIPNEQREVIIMRFYSELKLSEIARILGIPLSTVKSRLRLGMEKLKKEMEGLK